MLLLEVTTSNIYYEKFRLSLANPSRHSAVQSKLVYSAFTIGDGGVHVARAEGGPKAVESPV